MDGVQLFLTTLIAGIAATALFIAARVRRGGVPALIAKAVASVLFIATACAALAANPNNAAANRRLAQIELARGDYASARAHLEAAYGAAPSNRATRQLLGELYAVAGESERAAEMLSTVDVSLNQLDLRVFWYTHIGEQEKAERLKLRGRFNTARRLGEAWELGPLAVFLCSDAVSYTHLTLPTIYSV